MEAYNICVPATQSLVNFSVVRQTNKKSVTGNFFTGVTLPNQRIIEIYQATIGNILMTRACRDFNVFFSGDKKNANNGS